MPTDNKLPGNPMVEITGASRKVLFDATIRNSDCPPLSLGRNGVMNTHGVVIRPALDEYQIAAVTSRGQIGRGYVSVPADVKHLTALRDALDSIIEEME